MGGRFELEAHELVIAYGAHAWRLTDGNLADSGGVRGTVGGLTHCGAVAPMVAQRCGAACAGHVAQLGALCEQGLDALVAATRSELELVELRFVGGGGSLRDTDDDQRTDALAGTWDAELDLGPASTPASARFTARRPLIR